MATALQRIADWYHAQCNGTWEHGHGVRIETIDNPGWSITIDLAGTSLESRALTVLEDRFQDESDWLRCWREGDDFRATCGPGRLEDALIAFLKWAGKNGA